MSYAATARRAHATVARKGAPVTFTLSTGGTYDAATDTRGPNVTLTVSGYAVREDGNPLRYQALGLIPSEAPTLLFTPDVYGEVPAVGSIGAFGGQQYVVRDVQPIAPNGRASAASVVVTGGGPIPMIGRVLVTLAPLALSGSATFRANLASLRAGVTDALLAGAWTQPRLGSGNAVIAVDDARCSTSTGRLAFTGINAETFDCGTNYAGLDGATSATITVTGTIYDLSGDRVLISRWGSTAGKRQFYAYLKSGTGNLVLALSDAAGSGTIFLWIATVLFPVGTRFIAQCAFDGSQATDLAKWTVYYRIWNHAAQSWGAEVQDTGTSATAGYPAVFPTLTGAQNLTIGRKLSSASGANPWRGLIGNAMRVRPGVLLTTAQRAADLLTPDTTSANWVAPAIWPDLANGGVNLGTTGATYNGTKTANVVYCSDDTRWANPLISGPSSATPTYDPVTGRWGFDAFDDFVRSVGGPIPQITGDATVALIGAEPTATGTMAELSVGSVTRVVRAATLGTTIDTDVVASAPIALAAGVRALLHRRAGLAGAGVLGTRDGTAAEVTIADTSLTALTPDTLTVGGSRSTTPGGPTDLSLSAVLLLRTGATPPADFVTRYAADVFGATV